MTANICGVDVSKDRLDVCVSASGIETAFDNTPEGIEALAALCRSRGVTLVVMEASGGYERLVFLGLCQHGVPAARVNPRAVRDMAKALGYLEKTDRIDARIIARFAEVAGIAPQAAPDKKQRDFEDIAARLRQITRDIAKNKTRLHSARCDIARDGLRQVLDLLEKQAKTCEGELASLIDDDPLWRRLDAALREVKGVAGRTVITLLSEMPEIGTLEGKAAAKLAGLAPIADDSGKRTGKRKIRGGRANVRSILFLVAGHASRFHEGLADFKKRLIEAGKTKMTIRIALARKLLVILNAKARDTRKKFAMHT